MFKARLFHPQAPWVLGGVLAGIAVGVGALLGFAGPLVTVGVLAGLGAALWGLSSWLVGLWGVTLIVTLLPFASLPFKVVFTPTFLDLALGGVVLLYLLQWMTGQRRRLTLTPAHAPLLLFMLWNGVAFVAGLPNGPLTSNLIRQFVEMLLSMAFVLVLVDNIQRPATLRAVLGVLMLGGALAALVAVGLYVLPTDLSNRALSALAPLGYPAGDVLRYIEDNPDNFQRAIGTSIDPNALGGLLALIGAVMAPQLVAPRPVFGSRGLMLGAFGLVATALVLTFSRGAMLALGAALVFIAALRYRQLLVVLALGAALILLLPITQDYVLHFARGLQGQDLATQMRFGEYQDALTLIGRYPVLGVGFAGAPEIDLYLGVSNAYLLIASKTGLVGLALFGLVMGVVFGWAWRNRAEVYAHPELTAHWLGLHAALVAALVVGVVDHYFFNLDFQAAGTLFWMTLGLALTATRLAVKDGEG